MRDILDVCKYIIQYENEQGRSVSNLRLQKLLYFVQASYLQEFKRPCFSSEMQAWQYGPVVPEVYNAYRFFGSIGIALMETYDLSELVNSKREREVIDNLLNAASLKTTNQLVSISHNQTPWKSTYKTGEKNVIPLKDLESYFSN